MEVTIQLPDDLLTSGAYDDPETRRRVIQEAIEEALEVLEEERLILEAMAEIESGEEVLVPFEQARAEWSQDGSDTSTTWRP